MSTVPALPESKPYQFITLDDFSPGIYGEWYAGTGAQAAPDGAAQQSGTYGCVASQAGALIPGPKLVQSYTETLFDTDTANYPPSDAMCHITAFKNVSGVNTYPSFNQQQFLPTADSSVGNWLNDAGGGASLFNSINDVPLDTTDWIINTGAPSTYQGYFGTDTYTSGGRAIQYVSFQVTASVALVNSAGVGSTNSGFLNANGMFAQPIADGFSVTGAADPFTMTYTYYTNPQVLRRAWTDADIQLFKSGGTSRFGFVASSSNYKIYQVLMNVIASTPSNTGHFDQSFYAFQWWKAQNAGNALYNQKTKVRTYKFWSQPTSSVGMNPTTINGVTTFDLTNATTANSVGSGAAMSLAYGYTSLDVSRANKTTPTSPGNAIVASVVNPWVDNSVYSAVVYPDGTSTTTAATDATATLTITGTNAVRLCAHQDRVIAVISTASATSSGIAAFGAKGTIGYEELRATKTNDYSTDSGVDSIFVNEAPGNIGAMISMNASELYVLKNFGGGYSMRGDIVNPQIIRLPGVPSADINHIPCATPVAMIYGNSQGVWEFSGGDNATCISQQLDGKFWVPPNTQNYLGPVGSFAYEYPYVFAPNNWLWDIRKRGWFRLTNPATKQYAWASGSSEGLMILVPPQFMSGQSIADWYDIHQGQSSYQWTSQPLQRSLGRMLNFREINITGLGQGTVTVTLSGVSESQPFTETVGFSGTSPITWNIPTKCRAFDAVCTITSNATVPGGPAPAVHRITLGYEEGETARGGA